MSRGYRYILLEGGMMRWIFGLSEVDEEGLLGLEVWLCAHVGILVVYLF